MFVSQQTIHAVNIYFKVVRQIVTATTQRTKKESKSYQTKDTRWDRVPSEVTVSIESEKGNVKTQQEELKPNREGKIGKGGGGTKHELN